METSSWCLVAHGGHVPISRRTQRPPNSHMTLGRNLANASIQKTTVHDTTSMGRLGKRRDARSRVSPWRWVVLKHGGGADEPFVRCERGLPKIKRVRPSPHASAKLRRTWFRRVAYSKLLGERQCRCQSVAYMGQFFSPLPFPEMDLRTCGMPCIHVDGRAVSKRLEVRTITGPGPAKAGIDVLGGRFGWASIQSHACLVHRHPNAPLCASTVVGTGVFDVGTHTRTEGPHATDFSKIPNGRLLIQARFFNIWQQVKKDGAKSASAFTDSPTCLWR